MSNVLREFNEVVEENDVECAIEKQGKHIVLV